VIEYGNPNSYALNSIQLDMNPSSGTPTGFTVSLYSGGFSPADDLGALTGSDPSAGGVFAYTPTSAMTLSAGFYYLVVTSATPIGVGAYNWVATTSPRVTQMGSWYIDDAYYTSTDGSSWNGSVRNGLFEMAIYATPAPEPSSLWLLFVGGSLFVSRRFFTKAIVRDC
jgi:hypothetical protein